MNRAQQIRNRLAEIEVELAGDPPAAEPSDTNAFLTFIMEAMSPERRDALVEERRQLQREYDRLPKSAKGELDA